MNSSNIVICAIAKHENAYINDWVKWHIDIGYTKIYLYDNNEDYYPYVGDFISQQYIDKVNIIKVDYPINRITKQTYIYNKFIQSHYKEYDWCTFLDIDEYVNTPDLYKMLNNIPKNYYTFLMNWNIYGDDNILIGDESIPIYDRLHNKFRSNKGLFKTTLRGGTNIYTSMNAHLFSWYLANFKYCDCRGKSITYNEVTHKFNTIDYKDTYIAHYITKTLSEFIKYKFDRMFLEHNTINKKLDYFFKINEKTQEKIDYINNYLKNNGYDFKYS